VHKLGVYIYTTYMYMADFQRIIDMNIFNMIQSDAWFIRDR